MRRKFGSCRDLLLKTHVLIADLIMLKFDRMKLHTDLNQRKTYEIFRKNANHWQLKQKKPTNQLINNTKLG